MERPDIAGIKSGKELKRWYWLKAELVVFCKSAGVPYAGAKFEIIDRICALLDGQSVGKAASTGRAEKGNGLKWATETLTLRTKITSAYTNGPNSRRFFIQHCGDQFRFTIPFMIWMKENAGKTLREAVEEWKRQWQAGKAQGFESIIPKSNQYNQYLRDFFLDNPDKPMSDARYYWKLKRSLPGEHHYSRSDLLLKR